jgi:1,4-dihydroxy-2-naphthoate octaprenyltransferase
LPRRTAAGNIGQSRYAFGEFLGAPLGRCLLRLLVGESTLALIVALLALPFPLLTGLLALLLAVRHRGPLFPWKSVHQDI